MKNHKLVSVKPAQKRLFIKLFSLGQKGLIHWSLILIDFWPLHAWLGILSDLSGETLLAVQHRRFIEHCSVVLAVMNNANNNSN